MTAASSPAAVPRLLAGSRGDGEPLSLSEHFALHGPIPGRSAGRQLVELVRASRLRGRGGAGFPTGEKLHAVASRRGRPLLVANGAESEPLSDKDKTLLRTVPHLVLDGAVLAARAVRAREAIVAVSSAAPRELAALNAALAERRAARLDRVRLELAATPARFLAGEETALLHHLGGGPVKPTFTPPRPFERGLDGRPTLVQNVETLANVALVARFGSEWFRGLGSGEEPGSVLVTLAGAFRHPGVYEVPLGIPVSELATAAGVSADAPAFLVGGYFGSWVDARRFLGLRLLDAELKRVGASLGARTIVALPGESCGLVETARVARYLADESAGQCGPCLHGLRAVADGLAALVEPRPRGPAPPIPRWLAQVAGRGACHHPDGAARFVGSALEVFAEEVRRHERGPRCSPGRLVLPVPTGRPEAATA